MQLTPRLNELFHQHIRQFLVEMNVANLDQIRLQFSQLFDHEVHHRNVRLPPGLREFLIKRAVKAMQNDEQGHMVTRTQLDPDHLPENAPAWLASALESGQSVYNIEFKEGFADRLQHVVDWIASDQTAERVIRATPEQDFLGKLAELADRHFANKAAQAAPTQAEHGELVEMTFRTNPGTEQVIAYKENSTAPDKARGDVVAFWAELTTPDALNREGKLMGHCVSSYADLVRSQHVKIYSLRDARNQPHVTLEISQRYSDSKSINQVKGKRNQPPVGKYAPYVRDFLNDLGINPSEGGRGDLRGMGLLSHKGKFGTIVEVGGDILYTFQNGDTLRTLHEEDESTFSWMGVRSHHGQSLTYWYVERAGTVPFKLTLWPKEGKESVLSGLTMLRDEVSRYPVFATNLIKYLNESGIWASQSDKLAKFDVFYDKVKKLWGMRDDLTEAMFEKSGIAVSRLGDTAYFAHGDTLLASADLRLSDKGRMYGLSKLTVINDTPALRSLPAVITEFADKYFNPDLYSLMTDNEKDTIRGFGLTRRTKQGYRAVPEDKTIYSSKSGSVRYEANRLYFYTKAGVLLGSVYTGGSKENTGYYQIEGSKLFLFGSENRREVLQLISELTETVDVRATVEDFDYGERYRQAAELGFFQKNKKLVPLSLVVFSRSLPGGFEVVSEVGEERHHQSVSLRKKDEDILWTTVKEDDTVENISMDRNREDREESMAKYREQVALMLNVAKLQLKRRLMPKYFLMERNGKIYPQTDKRMIELYSTQKLDLGGGFYFRMGGGGRTFGAIELADEDTDLKRYRYGIAVVYVDWVNDDSKDELTYRMIRGGYLRSYHELKVTRAQIIRVTAKFQQFFHDKIEPYLSDDLVGGGTRRL